MCEICLLGTFYDSLFSLLSNISAFSEQRGLYFDLFTIEFLLVFVCAE